MGRAAAADDQPPQLRPAPCAYCAIEHGGYYFPELALTIPAEDRFPIMAMVKARLCQSVAQARIPCDPGFCVQNLRGATTRPEIGLAVKFTWQKYYAGMYEQIPDLSALLADWEL